MGTKTSLNIREFLKKILNSKKPLQEIDSIENPNLAALLRRKYLEEKLGISLSATGSSILDFSELEGKQSYKPVGAAQIPITIIGPLSIDGSYVNGNKYIPLASIYPALMKTVELGKDLLENTRIKPRLLRCWIRIFTATMKPTRDSCKIVEKFINNLYPESRVRLLCYGRGGGHIIHTVIIGEEKPCKTIHSLLGSNIFNELVEQLPIIDSPILTPYLAVDYNIRGEILKSQMDKNNIKPEYFIETYNAVEDLKPIDNSINPVILGSISSLYTALGVKPEYGLRTEIRQYMLYTRFRKILLEISSRITIPTIIRTEELSIMNRELAKLLEPEGLSPFTLSDIVASVIMATYTGILGIIARDIEV